MNLRQIEVFRAFMLTGTISDAARLLGVSQPAVSSMLRYVQDRCGIQLFESVKGRLLPTPEAQDLFAEIQLAWKSVERIQRRTQELAIGGANQLRIAASPSLGTAVIPTVLKHLERRFPSLVITLELFTPSLLIESLVNGDADIGVASHSVEHPGILTDTVGITPVVCVMPKGHALASRRMITLADLADEALVTHSLEMPEGVLITRAFHSAAITPRSRIQVRSGQSACWFVRSGAGIALIDSLTVANNAFPDLEIRPITPVMSFEVVVLRNPLRGFSKAASAFRQGIGAYCAAECPLSPGGLHPTANL